MDCRDITGIISILIAVKSKSSLGAIKDLMFSPERTTLCNIIGKVKNPNAFHRGLI